MWIMWMFYVKFFDAHISAQIMKLIDIQGHKIKICSVRTKHFMLSNPISAEHGNNHSLSKGNKDIYML